jgi:hypothetical protein
MKSSAAITTPTETHRQPAEQRREQQHRDQHDERVHHRRDRGAGAGAHVRGGAGDRARGGEAAEEGRHQVAGALGHQLRVGVVLAAGHAVCDHGREQGLDRAQRRDREGGGQQLADEREREPDGLAVGARELPRQHRQRRQRRDPVPDDAAHAVLEAAGDRRGFAARHDPGQGQGTRGARDERRERGGHARR